MLAHGKQRYKLDISDSVNIDDAPMTDWRDSYMLQSEDVVRYVDDPQRLLKHRATREIYPCLRNILLAHNAKSILDVGCNAGYTYDWLVDNLDRMVRYTGLDIHDTMVDEAQALHPPEVPFYTYDLYDLKDDMKHRADVVFCSRVLIHLPDFREAIEALYAACNKALVVTIKLGDFDRVVKYKVIDRDTRKATGEFFYLRTISYKTLDSLGMGYRVHSTGEYTTVEF